MTTQKVIPSLPESVKDHVRDNLHHFVCDLANFASETERDGAQNQYKMLLNAERDLKGCLKDKFKRLPNTPDDKLFNMEMFKKTVDDTILSRAILNQLNRNPDALKAAWDYCVLIQSERTLQALQGKASGPGRPKFRPESEAMKKTVLQVNQQKAKEEKINTSGPKIGLLGGATQTPKKASNLSVAAADFVPRQSPFPAYANQNNLFEDFQRLVNIGPQDINQSGPSPSVEKIIDAFNSILYEMTIQPGSVEDSLKPFVDLLQNCSDDQAINYIVESLFEQSIIEPNFRCTGAKVVQYLSNQLKGNAAFSNLRNLFLTRCKEEYLKKEELISHPESVSRLCGFTMFMGELFLNVEVENSQGVKQKIAVIRFIIRDLLLVLLEHSTDETVKSATQLLKMAGAAIEDTGHLNKPEEGNYSKIFARLGQLQANQHLNKTSQCLIASVLSLKSSNWGRRDSASSQPNMSFQNQQEYDLNIDRIPERIHYYTHRFSDVGFPHPDGTTNKNESKISTAQTSTSICVFCENKGIFFCYDCKSAFCKPCRENHDKLPPSKKHSVIDLKSVNPLAVKLRCELHKSEYNFYCIPCNTLVCNICVTSDHKGHDMSEIKAKSDEIKRLANTKLSDMKDNLQRISKLAKKTKMAHIPKLDEESKDAIARIRHVGEDLQKLIETKTDNKVNEVEDVTQWKKEELQSAWKNKERIHRKQTAVYESLKKLLSEEHAVSFLVSYQTLKRDMCDLTSEAKDDIEPHHIQAPDLKGFLDDTIHSLQEYRKKLE